MADSELKVGVEVVFSKWLDRKAVLILPVEWSYTAQAYDLNIKTEEKSCMALLKAVNICQK